MKTELSANQLSRYVGIRIRNPAAADQYWARCAGTAQDAAMDDETAAQIKEFLKEKLSASDHERVCDMFDGNFEAQDTEPYRSDPDEKPIGKLAGDAKADFLRMFPDSAKIGIDNSGIQPQPSGRAASYSSAGAASFAAMFPDAMKIGLL